MNSAADGDDFTRSGEFALALAVGQACSEATTTINERYVIDEAAKGKLINLVVRAARAYIRSGRYVSDSSDVDTIVLIAIRQFLHLKSGAS